MRPWWEEWPERLEYELEELRRANIEHRIIVQDTRTGHLEIELWFVLGSNRHHLVAKFPPTFPFTRFEIIAPDLDLPYHQNPFSKNLCLIGRESGNWEVNDTLAGFLKDRLNLVIQTANEPDRKKVVGLEERQGEPIGTYYSYAERSSMLVDSSWVLPQDCLQGELEVGIDEFSKSTVRGAVISVKDSQGKVLVRAEEAIANKYRGRTEVASWIRSRSQVKVNNPETLLRRVLDDGRSLPFDKADKQLVGIVFPEDLNWRTEKDGWIFVGRARTDRRGFRPGRHSNFFFAKAYQYGRVDFCARIPELSSLNSKKIAVIGLGCIGALSAIEMARSGVSELRLMDDDIVEPSTTVRWPFGLTAAGIHKGKSLMSFLSDNYPFTRVSALSARFGSVLGLRGADLKQITTFLESIDLVYDATAEVGIHYPVSEVCRELGVPFICASTTPGGWGGRIVRIRPGATLGCWVCLMHSVKDGQVPSPPTSPIEEFQPEGCADRTFTGAYFDIGQIALNGVRLAVATLTELVDGSYPHFGFDVAILSLRDSEGRFILPEWKSYELLRNANCTNH